MIKVYFESGRHAELVATFESESVYMACLPILEVLASEQRMIVTESIADDTEMLDNIRDVAIRIVDRMVSDGIIQDCIDTDIQTEFDAQDIATQEICKFMKIQETN